MIRPPPVDSPSEHLLVLPVGVRYPDGRWFSSFCAAKDDLLAVGRLALAEVPDRRVRACELHNRAVARVDPADLSAAPSQLRLEIAVEVIDVRTLGLVLSGDLGTGQAARDEDGPVP